MTDKPNFVLVPDPEPEAEPPPPQKPVGWLVSVR
jgi:hypothetical protein